MADIAERAIEHEVVLQGADLERRLTKALEVVRNYASTADAAAYIDAAATGERSGLEPFREIRAAHSPGTMLGANRTPRNDPYGVLAAFSRD